jgi:UDP-GlcNAc3NAcA epimerase
MLKIITVIGARPQFIKAATLSRVFAKYPDQIKEIIVHTGQHFDQNMSDIFFTEMEIPIPHYNLNINGLSHGAMTGQMLEGIEKIILAEKPDYLLVYGDTNSTIAGALAAKKLHVKVIHVEAGLRSYNMNMPEEINRILTDRISDILFCPTQAAINNLKQEGFDYIKAQIVLSGDVMQDAALYYKEKSDRISSVLTGNKIKSNEFILATIHRAENTDDEIRLRAIVHSLNEINKIIKVIVPLHPRTAKILKDKNIEVMFTIIKPVGYFDMLQLISHSRLILTDSGGLQKEAYFFNKYCITFRDETEWVELVDNGYNQIVGASSEKIIAAFKDSMNKNFTKAEELYGGGKAAETIYREIIKSRTDLV